MQQYFFFFGLFCTNEENLAELLCLWDFCYGKIVAHYTNIQGPKVPSSKHLDTDRQQWRDNYNFLEKEQRNIPLLSSVNSSLISSY